MRIIWMIIFLTVAGQAAASPVCAPGSSPSDVDSLRTFDWSAVFTVSLEKYRESAPFSWNAPESLEWSDGRLAADLRYRPSPLFDAMARLSASDGREGDGGQLFFEQGHLRFAGPEGLVAVRLFLRERVFRTGNRLMVPVSPDASLLDGHEEGIEVALRPSKRLELFYGAAALRSRDTSLRHGGLPVMGGWEGGINMLGMRAEAGFAEAGIFLVETRSPAAGDGVLTGLDAGISAWRFRLQVEMAGWREGRLDEVEGNLFPSIDPERAVAGRTSGAFSDDDAFAAEVHGLEFDLGGRGRIGLIPGYRYTGARFRDPAGEMEGGTIETALSAWWRHPSRELSLFLDASDLYVTGSAYSGTFLRGVARARLKNGLETFAGVLIEKGKDPSAMLSILDENERTRLRVTARMDGGQDRDLFSFLAEGHINLSSRVAVRTSLFLDRSDRSHYSLHADYRSGRRFLFRVGLGDYDPFGRRFDLMHDLDWAPVSTERYVTLTARMALGGL